MRFTVLCASVTAVTAAIAAPAANAGSAPSNSGAGPFTIRLGFPAHVGDTGKSRVHLSRTRESSITYGGRVLQDQHSYREVECIMRNRVLKLSAAGRVVKIHVEFLTFGGRTSTSAPFSRQNLEGAAVDVTTWPELSIVRTDGKNLSTEARAYLSMLFRKSDGISDETDDTLYGPPGPVRVGDTWTGDNEKLASDFNRDGFLTISVNDVSALFTANALQDIGGIDCMDIRGSLDFGRITAQPDVRVKVHDAAGTMHVDVQKSVSIDPPRGVLRDSTDMQINLSGQVDVPRGGHADYAYRENEHEENEAIPTIRVVPPPPLRKPGRHNLTPGAATVALRGGGGGPHRF